MKLTKDQFLKVIAQCEKIRFGSQERFEPLLRDDSEELSENEFLALLAELEGEVGKPSVREKHYLLDYLVGNVQEDHRWEAGDRITDNGVHARWASSTGYRSTLGIDDPDTLYQKALGSCFLVGRCDAEMWSYLSKDYGYPGCVKIRFPNWHRGEVAWALYESAGLFSSNLVNNMWCFPANITMSQAKALLKPVLEPGTRLADEADLAAQILATETAISLRQDCDQAALF